MTHPAELPQRLAVSPPLSAGEVRFVAGFGQGDGRTRRLWPGQPGPRSPWLPCADGCCLHLDQGVVDPDAATWLRFLVREVLAPRSAAARARAAAQSLPGGHRLDGRVLLGQQAGVSQVCRLVVVVNNRVRERPLDDDLEPPARPEPAAPGRVLDLDRRRGLRAPSGRPRPSAPRSPPS